MELCERESLKPHNLARLRVLVKDFNVSLNCCTPSTCDTPLMLLCRYNQSESLLPSIKALLEQKRIDLALRNSKGHNALTLICRYNQHHSLMDCIRLLVHYNIEVTVTDDYHRNALILLCEFYKGNDLFKCVQFLLNCGTDVTVKERYGRRALHFLCQSYKKDDFIRIARLLAHQMDANDLKNCQDILQQRNFFYNEFSQHIRPLCKIKVNPPKNKTKKLGKTTQAAQTTPPNRRLTKVLNKLILSCLTNF